MELLRRVVKRRCSREVSQHPSPREADEVQLVDYKLRLVEVDRGTMLPQPMQKSSELTIVVSIVQCDHNDIIESICRALTAIVSVADELLEAGRSGTQA